MRSLVRGAALGGFACGLGLLAALAPLAQAWAVAAADAASTPEARTQLAQLLAQWRAQPDDEQLRSRIIALATSLTPPPSVPDEAWRSAGAALAAVEHAQSPADYLQAVQALERAVRLAPWVADLYWNLGLLQEKAEQHHAAVRSFQRYLEAKPGATPQERAEALQRIGAAEAVARQRIGLVSAPMGLVPAGEFLYGLDRQRLSLPAFSMDQHEVTTALYARFMAATGRNAPSDWQTAVPISHGQKPVVGVTWHEAEAYCRYYGKRLPTEQEWEKAARGTDGRTYPWGHEPPTSRHANFGRCCAFQHYAVLGTVGTLEDGKSPYGMYDLAGNVWEWTSSDDDSPISMNVQKKKVLRGGSWASDASDLKASHRSRWSPDYGDNSIGFRCVQDAR